MLEFKITQELKPNPKLLELIKEFTYKTKIYYHLRCKNTNCKGYGYHYNSDKIENKLKRILNELTRFMYDNSNEIITCSSTKSIEVKDIEKAIEKVQEKRLVDLYLSSTLDVETINHKNDVIKKEIDKLTKKKTTLDPDNDFKEYTVELLKKLDYEEDNGDFIFKNNLSFAYLFDSLN